MERKDFLKTAGAAYVLPFVMNGFGIKAFGATPFLDAIAKASAKNGKVFVLIQLNGGNDGLNTIIPIDQYSNLLAARSNVLINQNKVLPLNGKSSIGMHPSMTGLQNLYNNGKMSIVQSVGYPNPNLSHFRSTDIWNSASDSNAYVSSGWSGRYLEDLYTGYPKGFPNATDPDPLAISIGYTVSNALMGATVNTGMAITDPSSFYQLVNGTTDPAPSSPAGHELTYVRLVLQQTQAYNEVVKKAAGLAKNIAAYPAKNSLADQLKIVANLIAGGLRTSVYTVSLGGFDTHSAQVASTGGTDTGEHANLLNLISTAIAAFQDDCEKLGIADRVTGMTYSEFGRRIKSNGSFGTDHGAAAPLIVFGKNVIPGIIGSNPIIPSNVTVDDNVPMQHDFRQVYASVLEDWFDVTPAKTDSDLMFKHFDTLPIFKLKTGINSLSAEDEDIYLKQNYPNPFKDFTTLEFVSPGGKIELRLFDSLGKLVKVIVSENLSKGVYTKTIDGFDLSPGNYYYQLVTPKGQLSKQLVKI